MLGVEGRIRVRQRMLVELIDAHRDGEEGSIQEYKNYACCAHSSCCL